MYLIIAKKKNYIIYCRNQNEFLNRYKLYENVSNFSKKNVNHLSQ